MFDESSLRTVYLKLVNQTDESQTFHFVLEATDGLGQWHEFALNSGATQQVVVEPTTDSDWSKYHCVAGDEQTSGTLLGQGDERSCLQLNFEITDDQINGLMPSDQPAC